MIEKKLVIEAIDLLIIKEITAQETVKSLIDLDDEDVINEKYLAVHRFIGGFIHDLKIIKECLDA